MKMPSDSSHWRDSARYPRFFIIDARAAFPVLLVLVHFRTWTVVLALVTTVFFSILQKYGFTPAVFGRVLRTWIGGARKVAVPWWLK